MGTLVVKRNYNMVDWLDSVNDIQYFAEKVPNEIRIREYSEALVRAWLDELPEEFEEYNDEPLSADGLDEIETLRMYIPDGPDAMYSQLSQTKHLNYDGSDPPSFEWFTHLFYWQYLALRWWLKNAPKESLQNYYEDDNHTYS